MADQTHTERRAPTTAGDGAGHGAVIAAGHGAHAAHGHDAHHDEVMGDKRAAFIGLFGGAVLVGALVYGMVTWTNARYASHEGGEKAAAESTR